MSGDPSISIIVPTCGRRDSLRVLLGRLSWQASALPFEVVVVLDGVTAEAAGLADSATAWPFPVRIAQVHGRRGAAAARNLGAAVARGALLLFLDDDVEPGPGVLAAHARLHAQQPMLIGAGALTPRPVCGGFIGNALAGWWEVMNERLADPRHRFAFRDLLTGHCSMTRETFELVGAFDESLWCHEDFEFGVRALAQGVCIRYARGADAEHRDASDLAKILQRKRDEGRADVQLVRAHPALVSALPLGSPLPRSRTAGLMQRLPSLRAGLIDRLVPATLCGLMRLCERLTMRDKWRWALDRAMDFCYWSGVHAEAGSGEAVDRLRAATTPQVGTMVDLDLLEGLPAVEARLDRLRPDGVRIWMGQDAIGVVRPEPGREPFRGIHLRPILLTQMAEPFTQAAARAGLLPPVLQGCVGPANSRDRCGIINPP